MNNALERAKVRLTGVEIQKFLQRMQSDPKFSRKCREILRSGNEKKLATFLKNHGFKLG